MAINFPDQPNLYVYDKNRQRVGINQPDRSFFFFGSGSTGNSVYLKDSHLLIDLGFPFSRYVDMVPNFWYDVRYILLTHEHSDHLNEATLMHLLDVYPHLKFFISKRMFERITGIMFYTRFNKNKQKARLQQESIRNKYYRRFIIIDADANNKSIHIYPHDLVLQPTTIIPHFVSHADIVNVAYEIITPKHHVLYASDLDHVFAPKPKDSSQIEATLSLPLEYDSVGNVKPFTHPFDIIFLEANYDADYLHKFLQLHPEDPHAQGNLRHISEQEAFNYIKYALSDNGIFIPLHASQAFGTLVQDLRSTDATYQYNN